MTIEIYRETIPSDVLSLAPRLRYGLSQQWIEGLRHGFGHPTFHLVSRDMLGCWNGYLPIQLVKGPIFGRFLVSMPYVNSAGVWCTSELVQTALLDRAISLADELDVRYLELRSESELPHPKLTFVRREKMHMRLKLPASIDELDKSFKSKLRSQIKKASENDLSIRWGGQELLGDFYHVFAINMRDLGTPVFHIHLFRSILGEFNGQAEMCVVEKQGKAIATALLVHDDGITEVPSASSLRQFNSTGANMWMYNQLLQRAIARGSHTFDFGRSSEGSGTYKFKSQWNAKPSPAIWQYYLRKGSADDMRPDSSGNHRLIQIWQKLPVWLTRWIGPTIVRGIP
jgi:serine/alanine adding enzyme